MQGGGDGYSYFALNHSLWLFLSKTRALVAKSDSCNQLATNTAIHLIRGIEWEEKDSVCVCVSDGEDAVREQALQLTHIPRTLS